MIDFKWCWPNTNCTPLPLPPFKMGFASLWNFLWVFIFFHSIAHHFMRIDCCLESTHFLGMDGGALKKRKITLTTGWLWRLPGIFYIPPLGNTFNPLRQKIRCLWSGSLKFGLTLSKPNLLEHEAYIFIFKLYGTFERSSSWRAFPSPQPHMLKGDHGPEKAQPDNSCARLLRLDIPLGAFKQIGGLLNSAICSNEYSCLWAGQHQPKLLSCIKRLPLSLAHYALSMSKTNQVQHAQKSLWRISAVTV